MGKQIKIYEQQVTGNPTVNNPKVIVLPDKVVALSITNMANSSNELLIGWDENPSTKNFLSQSESRPYGPYSEGQYIAKQAVKFAFVNIGGGALNPGVNQALVSMAVETDEEVC
jgi:hypothetical protein